jgi:hypothetical protein
VELRRNGTAVLAWSDAGNRIVEPGELAGVPLNKLRPWIESQPPERREAARLLQWGAIIANGRGRSLDKQSDASALGVGRCFTFRRTVSMTPGASTTSETSVKAPHRC